MLLEMSCESKLPDGNMLYLLCYDVYKHFVCKVLRCDFNRGVSSLRIPQEMEVPIDLLVNLDSIRDSRKNAIPLRHIGVI